MEPVWRLRLTRGRTPGRTQSVYEALIHFVSYEHLRVGTSSR